MHSKRELLEETGLNITKITKIISFSQNGYLGSLALCQIEYGKPKLGGPEAQRNSESDWYNPQWTNVKFALVLDNLYPEPVSAVFRKMYG